ncbi:hypothetical protein SP15_124 [Bacillus phage SP-15]|uniref:Uncharacterized protein n=1 Tax=Bacillus phage SP-15 TaxID=1792032 RepID=A0A127AWG1_9CAUD|nr:hypothetical protein SP15_124 [Bacillus phage SP-15]AMM44922.1 hypothetical protein SP15_124 [Bacillus phage SP-15]
MKRVIISLEQDNEQGEVLESKYQLVLESPERDPVTSPWTNEAITEEKARSVAKLLGFSTFRIYEEKLQVKEYQV